MNQHVVISKGKLPATPLISISAAVWKDAHNTPGSKFAGDENAADLRHTSIEALAHEIRNPLASINLAVSILESSVMDEESKSYLQMILRSSLRINSLVTELLMSKAEVAVAEEKYSLNQLLEDVLELTRDRINIKKIIVIKDYTSEDNYVGFNVRKMRIALTNIVVNAIESMEFGKGELRLTTQMISGIPGIQIGDNGCGISKRNIKLLFKPYFTKKRGGIGLGLSITYNILMSNHVVVHVTSKEGKGTQFTLSFN